MILRGNFLVDRLPRTNADRCDYFGLRFLVIEHGRLCPEPVEEP